MTTINFHTQCPINQPYACLASQNMSLLFTHEQEEQDRSREGQPKTEVQVQPSDGHEPVPE